MNLLASKPGLAAVLSILLFAGTAHAFKITTHLWLADQIYGEIESGSVDLGTLGRYPVPAQIQRSITRVKGGKEAFLIGVLGPDLYPDLIAGQMTTHPGLPLRFSSEGVPSDVASLSAKLGRPIASIRGWQTDDWLKHVRDKAFSKSRGKPSREIAFAYGYMLHAAMDTWAHTYVNLYTGDLFSIKENQEVAARHVAIESYIANVHKSFFRPANAPPSGSKSSGIVQQQAQRIVAQGKRDNLARLSAPTRFVRETLILNPLAADQHARTAGAQHVWAMYALWDAAKNTRRQWMDIRGNLDQAVNQVTRAVLDAEPVWQAADTAKTQAAAAATGALNAKRDAEKFALDQAKVLDSTITQVLNYLNGLPGISATRNTIENFISQLPPPLSDTYKNAKQAFANADKARSDAINAYESLAAASNQAAQAAVDALNNLDLKKNAEAGLKQARNLAWTAVDNNLTGWRNNIEAGVDAYIRAWEEVAKEIMRPQGNRFSKGSNVTWPLKNWAVCWGPVFGMPALPVNPQAMAGVCVNSFSGFDNANENLRLMVVNQVFDLIPGGDTLRNRIIDFDNALKNEIRKALPQAGQMIANAIPLEPVNMVPGTASFMAQSWDKYITVNSLNTEFADDSSRKKLPTYAPGGPNSIASMLEVDGLPTDLPSEPAKSRDLNAMLNFPPIHNAMMLSRLTFLGGEELNRLARNAGVSFTYYKNVNPVYPDSARAGDVLIGAIRSIDGNHQWQPVAPRLPQGNRGNLERVTEGTCRRFGYPFAATYGEKCEGDNYNLSKGGFRFWIDPNLRTAVFNELFKGPMSPSLCTKLGSKVNDKELNQGIGCSSDDPFPASEETDIAMERYRGVGGPMLANIVSSPPKRVQSTPKRQPTTGTKRPVTSAGKKPVTVVTQKPATTRTTRLPATQRIQKAVPAKSVAIARVIRVNPARSTLYPGRRLTLTLEGQNLNSLSALRIRRSGRDVPGFRTTLEPPRATTQTRRRMTVEYSGSVAPGSYELALFAGRRYVAPPRGTIVSVAVSTRPPAPKRVR